jgi:hypothetical protein
MFGFSSKIQYIIIIILFVVTMIFYMKYGNGSMREGFSNYRCPNVLIQKGKNFFLFNTKLAKVPGVNPLQFSSLEDYKEFMEWQRSQGIKCPVLYVQQSFDAQGNEVYQQRPNPFDLQGGLGSEPSTGSSSFDDIDLSRLNLSSEDLRLYGGGGSGDGNPPTTLLFDAGRADPPYNQGHYPSFDPQNQYIGDFTPLDQMNVDAESGKYSADPMDPNWGGPEYSQALVHQGYYKENEVYKYAQGM